MPENVYMGQSHHSKACWELWLSDDQPHSENNGQWQMALCICMVAVLQSSQPNPQRNKRRKMYAIKQIKICAEYGDMLPRPRLNLSDTPGLPPIGLSPGSWQISLGLGSMTRYSAQILICIPVWCIRSWPGDWIIDKTWLSKPMIVNKFFLTWLDGDCATNQTDARVLRFLFNSMNINITIYMTTLGQVLYVACIFSTYQFSEYTVDQGTGLLIKLGFQNPW